jgi:hypothetical protein
MPRRMGGCPYNHCRLHPAFSVNTNGPQRLSRPVFQNVILVILMMAMISEKTIMEIT